MKIARILSLVFVLCPLTAGAAERVIDLDPQTQVRTWVITPRNSGLSPSPLAILIPAGSGKEFVVKAQFWLGKQLNRRGWAVALPVDSQGRDLLTDNQGYLEKVIDEIQADEAITPGRTLLVGISSGGTSALEIAARKPTNYYGVVAVPGKLNEDWQVPDLDGLRVFLRIGENDKFRWNKQLEAITGSLQNAGAQVDSALVPNARHIFKLDWTELDIWLQTIR